MGFETGLKTIVVATDLEERSGAALEYARKLAGAYGARIVLAHGIDPMDFAAMDRVPGKLRNKLPEDARAVLDQISAELSSEGIPSHSEVRQGEVTQMLLDVIRQYKADLIVIGTKGRRGVGPVAVGTLAEQLVRRSPCPVMAVAADWNAGPFRPTPGGPVLLAMEKNEALQASAMAAMSLAETFNRPLLVLHARTAAETVSFLNPTAMNLKDCGVDIQARCPVRCMVKDGKPADVVEAAIEQYRPSVLVIGVKRRSGTPGPHGTAFALLARSRVPVICVPPETAPATKEHEEVVPTATTEF